MQAMNDNTEMERIARYLAGEMTAAESSLLERDADGDARLAARLEAARAAWSAVHNVSAPVVDVEAAWSRLMERADVATAERADVGPRVLRLARRRRMSRPAAGMRAAAAVVLLAAAALVWRGAQSPGTELATAAGELRTWRLPDGSRVRLGPQSRLHVRGGYGTRHRDVELDGEAFFIAAPGDASPLTVTAGDARVRDLGTAFVVRTDAMDGGVRVVVTEGAVWLGARSDADSGVRLAAGEIGVYDDAAHARRVGTADTAVELAWTRGRLVFADATLADVARQLERWHGLDVRVSDPRLGARRLSASFEDEPVTEVLSAIARSLAVAFTRSGDTVVFRDTQGDP